MDFKGADESNQMAQSRKQDILDLDNEEEALNEEEKGIIDSEPVNSFIYVVDAAFNSFLKHESSGIHFMNEYFNMKEGQSLSNFSLEDLCGFIIESFFNQEDEELSMKALKIICVISQYNNFDLSPFCTPDFIKVYISLLRHPNKEFAIVAATTLYDIFVSKRETIEIMQEFDFVERIFDLMISVSIEEDEELYDKCATTISKFYMPLIRCDWPGDNFGEVLLNFANNLIKLQLPLTISRGFICYNALYDRRLCSPITEKKLKGFIQLSMIDDEILDSSFKLFDTLKRCSDFEMVDILGKEGFFDFLIDHISEECFYNVHIFRFLEDFDIFPEPETPFFDKLMCLLASGVYDERVAILKTFLTYITEKMDEAENALLNAGILEIVAELFSSRIDKESLVCALQIVDYIISFGIKTEMDFWEMPGIEEIRESLLDRDEIEDPIVSNLKEKILNYYPEEED